MGKLYTILFKVPELQRKILMTAMFLAIYRIGYFIPLHVVDQAQLEAWQANQAQSGLGKVLSTVAMFGGAQIGMSTIFGLGIMPYISASIIFQLLGSVVPSLEAMMKEGESGRKKINEYTRYATVVLCLVQSTLWVQYMMNSLDIVHVDNRGTINIIVCVLTMTAGTIFLMWIGEQIDEYGIGNGISLLIMAGILARMPSAMNELLMNSTTSLNGEQGKHGIFVLITLAVVFLAVVVGVIAITESQRRIPTQSAKHVRGRRVYGGTKQYLPLKVNQAGVIPVIFGSSLLYLPDLISRLAGSEGGAFQRFVQTYLVDQSNWLHIILYIALIIFFTYFYVGITFNPEERADEMKKFGGFIPGIRPGRPTAEYLNYVLSRITLPGSLFLATIAVIPLLVFALWDITQFPFGGTALLITVGVALETMKQIDSQLMMRNYEGFLA